MAVDSIQGLDGTQSFPFHMLGGFEDRARYNAALEAIDDPAKRDAFMAKWQDGRSSLNNIGGAAHEIGKALLLEVRDAV